MEENKEKHSNLVNASELSETVYLTSQNAVFQKTEGGFVSLVFANNTYNRVKISRAFPFESPSKFICVSDAEGKEIGIISDIGEFSGEARAALEYELSRCYFMPRISKINAVKEQFGYSFWTVETEKGSVSFSIKDTFRNIVNASNGRYFVCDVEGNRYEIQNIDLLDNKSIKRLEIYL